MTITKEDLMLTCDECEGKGNTRVQRVNKKKTFGDGIHYQIPNNEKCKKCHGNGIVFTEAGQAIACVVLQMQENGFNIGFLTGKCKS